MQFETHTLNFRDRAQSKCGTFDYLDRRPGGGDKKVIYQWCLWSSWLSLWHWSCICTSSLRYSIIPGMCLVSKLCVCVCVLCVLRHWNCLAVARWLWLWTLLTLSYSTCGNRANPPSIILWRTSYDSHIQCVLKMHIKAYNFAWDACIKMHWRKRGTRRPHTGAFAWIPLRFPDHLNFGPLLSCFLLS